MRGTIQHRPDRPAPWRARYRGPDGRGHTKSFDRKIDAERWLRTELAKLDRGQWIDPNHGSIEWADYSKQVIADRPHLSTRTIETDRLCHDRIKAWIGDTPPLSHHTRTAPPLDGGTHHSRLRLRDRRPNHAMGQARPQPSSP